MMDTIKLLNERAASYGALRQSSLTAVAMDCAAVELAAANAQVEELTAELAAAHATIHQLGENAAKAAAEYAEEVGRLRGMLTEAADAIEDGSIGQTMCCSGHECGCYGADKGSLLVWNIRSYLARAALTEPTDEG